MNALAEMFLAIFLAGSPADDLDAVLASAQQGELARVGGEFQQLQKSARQSRGTPGAASNKIRLDQLRAEQRAINAGNFTLPRLEPEKLASGAIGVLWDPAPYEPRTELHGRADVRAFQTISNAMYESAWYKLPWNTFRVARVLSPREFVASGRKAEFVVHGLDTATMGEGQEVSLPQVVRVVAPGERRTPTGERLMAVEVLDPRPAADVVREWAKKGGKPKKPKPARR